MKSDWKRGGLTGCEEVSDGLCPPDEWTTDDKQQKSIRALKGGRGRRQETSNGRAEKGGWGMGWRSWNVNNKRGGCTNHRKIENGDKKKMEERHGKRQ